VASTAAVGSADPLGEAVSRSDGEGVVAVADAVGVVETAGDGDGDGEAGIGGGVVVGLDVSDAVDGAGVPEGEALQPAMAPAHTSAVSAIAVRLTSSG
jgi:hypothetical protein